MTLRHHSRAQPSIFLWTGMNIRVVHIFSDHPKYMNHPIEYKKIFHLSKSDGKKFPMIHNFIIQMAAVRKTTQKAQNLIFCTGFDIFGEHEKVNASWEAVKLLPNLIKHGVEEYRIEKLKIPVTYKDVDEVIPKIWEQNPKLVIHCGVNSKATSITLEACASNFGFCKPGSDQQCLEGTFAKLEKNGKGKKILLTTLDVEKIASELNAVEIADNCENNKPGQNPKFIPSTDVGSYLCCYSFLKSLDYDLDRSLFIHVPVIDKPFSSEEVSKGIFEIIKKCLDQLNEKNL